MLLPIYGEVAPQAPEGQCRRGWDMAPKAPELSSPFMGRWREAPEGLGMWRSRPRTTEAVTLRHKLR